MTRTLHKFNINENVRVRLTDHGRRILRAQAAALRREFPGINTPYTPPKEDAEGWSEWQLWNLMHRFGLSMELTGELPFEIEIEIPL